MDLKSIYRSLSPDQQLQFLRVAETTDAYMTVHLIHRRRVPRPDLMARIANACRAVGHEVDDSDVVLFFHGRSPTASHDAPADTTGADLAAPKRERGTDSDGRRPGGPKPPPDSNNRRVKPARRASLIKSGPEAA